MTYRLRDFGSYTVGGRLHEVTKGTPVEIAVTRDVCLTHDPKGHFAVEHAYVQYFMPEPRNAAPPVVLVHGGGLCGSVWEGTPDGRPGWLQLLLRRGYEVHVIDNVERGRAGFAPGLWTGAPILRSLEDAWTLFRIGPPDGFAARAPHPGQRFPADHLDPFARIFVPRWLSTGPMQVAAMSVLLDRLGGALVLCHSQGAEAAFGAIDQGAPVAGLIAVEPSAGPADLARLRDCPTVLVSGDYLDQDSFWRDSRTRWARLHGDLDAIGAPVRHLGAGQGLPQGHSHLPMLDHGNDACLDAALDLLGLPV
jgi:pimeloyl-ACP methyl ester carboxylesterase